MTRTLYLSGWRTEVPLPAEGLVITPNRRAASAIGQPPLSLEGLARRRLRVTTLQPAPELLAQRLLLDLARSELDAPDPAGLIQAYAPVIKAFFRADADLDALIATGPARSARVARLARAYRTALRDQGWYDPAEALRLAAANPGEPEALHLRGYPRLGADEQAWLLAAAGPGSTVHLPAGPQADYADARALAQAWRAAGWQVVDLDGRRDADGTPLTSVTIRVAGAPDMAPPPLSIDGPAIAAYAHADMEQEVRATLAAVKRLLLAGTPPEAIAVIARDDAAYGPLALDVAWEYGVPLRALYAVPLRQTRVGAWLDLMLEAASEGCPFEATYRLLHHPLSPPCPDALRAEVRRAHPTGAAAWRALGAELPPLSWPAQASRADWLVRLRGLLHQPDLRRRAARWPRELLALRTLAEALPTLLDPPQAALGAAGLRAELSWALDQLGVPAQPGRGGVELHTPLSLFGARYTQVFVLGLVEGVLPAPVSDSPVVDFHERRKLAALGVQLEDAPAAARRERLSFLAMAHTATEHLTLSCPRLYAGKPVVPSGFFAELGLRPGPAPLAPVASVEEARALWLAHPDLAGATEDLVLPAARAALAVEDRREGQAPPDEHDGIVGRPFDLATLWLSATKLVALGQCPFRWYAQYGLGLAAPDEPEDAISPSLRGTLYHQTLELALAEPGPDVRQSALAQLETAFAAAEVSLAIPQRPTWPRARQEHLQLLRRAIRSEAFIAAGASVVAREARFEGSWHGLQVRGSVDRIDRSEAGLTLIDYKTRASKPPGAKDANGQATLDVQLPLYEAAAAPVLFPDLPVAGARYYSLTAAKDIPVKPADADALAAFAERVKANLTSGAFPVEPDAQGHACSYCDVALVCRKGPRLARKLGATSAANIANATRAASPETAS